MRRHRRRWSRWVGGNMNNYEGIKQMSLEQMAVTLYLLIAPFMEKLGEVDEQTRLAMIQQIKGFLSAEVKTPEKK